MKKGIKDGLLIFVSLIVIAVSVFFVYENRVQTAGSNHAAAQSAQLELIQPHTEIKFGYGAKTFSYGRQNYEIDSDIFTVKNELRARIKPSHAERVREMQRARELGFTDQQAVEYAFIGLDKVVAEIKQYIDIQPVNAEISFNPAAKNMFKITPDKVGYDINLDKLYAELFSALEKSPSSRLSLRPEKLTAEVTAADLHAVTQRRSVFSTGYKQSIEARKHNVKLALNKFNGMRIDKGDVVSFNTVVGARSVRNGFKEAKIIKNGQYEDGVGGGVCQSSTTLYNALILADVNIKKVSQHSLACSYVEPSFDAMVNSSWSDLVFENTYDMPIFIRTICDDDRVTVEVYGSKLPYEIKRRSVVTGTVPHAGDKEIVDTAGKYLDRVQYQGDKVRISHPKDGLESEGYLDYYADGKLIKTRKVRKNKYLAQQGIVVEGNLPKPEPTPDPTPDPKNPIVDFFKSLT